MTLLPDGVTPAGAAALVVLSYLTSLLTAAVGMGGGVTMLAAMAYVLPVPALVPVHGLVQLGSNTGRAIVLLPSAVRGLLVPFTVGAVVGAGLGGLVLTELPEDVILLAIGSFVVLTTWVKIPSLGHGDKAVVGLGGVVATALTLFIGATGPFVMALLRPGIAGHRALVATSAAAMTVQHGLKVAVFGLVGFAFGAYLPLTLAMIATGVLGTLTGARLMDRLPERWLAAALKAVLTVLGAELVVRALVRLAGGGA